MGGYRREVRIGARKTGQKFELMRRSIATEVAL